jgi:putative flavoprotein involved in K+ transport
MSFPHSAEHIDVAVIGAGQAGLSVSHHLRTLGVEHQVFERNRIGETWRSSRWDSFTLVTPNWMTRLAGYRPEAGTARRFLPRAELVGVLERLADGLPVRQQTPVTDVAAAGDGYQMIAGDRPVRARAVVVAGGGLRRPAIPAFSRELSSGLFQTDAGGYRNPAGLPPGAVLVVGSGQSGAQISEELAAAGRDVFLATSRAPRVPRRYRGRDIHEWSVELGLYDQRVEQLADREQLRQPNPVLSGAGGGHTLTLQQLARDGVALLGRLVGAEGTKLRFAADLPDNMHYADQRAAQVRRLIDEYVDATGTAAAPADFDPAERPWLDPAARTWSGSGLAPELLDSCSDQISTVIWCTGFRPDTAWLDVPVLAPGGSPIHTRGVTAAPGLFVAGYPWLSHRGSGILYGVDADAARVAQHVATYLTVTSGRLGH